MVKGRIDGWAAMWCGCGLRRVVDELVRVGRRVRGRVFIVERMGGEVGRATEAVGDGRWQLAMEELALCSVLCCAG